MARPDLSARIALLRRQFIDGLSERALGIERWQSGERDPLVLARIAHQLRGVAPTHGLSALGAVAATVEDACKVEPGSREDLEAHARCLREAIEEVVRREAGSADPGSASTSISPSIPSGERRVARPLEGRRVVAIDDDLGMRRLLSLTLEQVGGARAVIVSTPLELFEELEKERPEILIADVMMPTESGPALLARVASAGLAEEARIVLLSASAQGEVLARSNDPVDPRWVWMVKPFRPPELVAALAALLTESA